jgi:putative transcription factor
MECEMCGEKAPTSRVLIEGAVLNLCPKCAKFGKEIARPPRPSIVPQVQGTRGVAAGASRSHAQQWEEPDMLVKGTGGMELSDESPRMIREARQRSGWTQEQLGKMINEKKSVIQLLETGAIRPDDKLIKKLEKTLNVKLKEKSEEK